MAIHEPNDFMMQHCDCHVCGKHIREDQNAVEHSGAGQYVQNKQLGEGYVSVWLHPECAAVLAMRLMHDVMRIKHVAGQPPRVVDTLQNFVRFKNSPYGDKNGTTIQQA